MNNINNKQALLLSSLTNYYKENNHIKDTIIPIINGEVDISLRLLDWFITNYSKTYNSDYILNKERFVVYTNYKSQLKSFQKKNFDPFQRGNRIYFNYEGDNYFETTVGQLNFFRWAIKNNIIEYVKMMKKDIEDNMNTCIKMKKVSIKPNNKPVHKCNVNIVLTFD
jgi:hypothetical protein